MRYPRFIAEVAHEANRRKLEAGVWSGYALAAAFELLALLGQWLEVVPVRGAFHALVALKLATNTLAWLGLRYDRAVLETNVANTFADLVVMTGAIYYTGGQTSPLFVIYIIEISVLALLANRGVTLVVASLSVAMFSTLSVLIHLGWLTQYPSPLVAGSMTTGHLVLGLAFAAFVLLLPTAYTSSILAALRQREIALAERTRALVEAGRQKSQFMANVTHELRTPIHGISAVSELLTSEVYGPLAERQREAQESIAESARSMLALVDQLLLLAKDEAGRLQPASAPVDLSEVLEAVASSVRWMVELKGQQLEREQPESLPALWTDGALLKHVLVNLLVNAVKFTHEGGKISLVLSVAADHVTFAVRDDGIGIPEHEVAHVFDPFRQVDGSDERRYGGVGLGLTLVDRLTRLLGGSVEVESHEGHGSTFTVTLPRFSASDPPQGRRCHVP